MQPPSSQPRIRAGSVVQPDTVTVGDPFVFTVTVEVPSGARVEWPSIGDSTAVVSQRLPVAIRDASDGNVRRETAQYSLSAWDTGRVEIAFPDAIVRQDELTVRVPVGGNVYVRSVLPRDTTQHVPKPAKALFPREIPWWEQWWLAALIVALLALLYWWYRRRKRVRPLVAPRPTVDVYARAMADFDRLERLALIDSGERGRYVALATEVLRGYLAARVPAALLSLTSSELVTAVRTDSRVPVTRLAPLLGEADAIKFAQYPVDEQRARHLGNEARGIVDDVERAEQERLAAVAAEREAAAKREAALRDSAEENARRRSRRGAA